MAIQMIAQGSPSQQASARVHLERRSAWTYVRIGGTRYVVLPSGRSGSIYWVRADAAGCSCRWYAIRHTTCAHMLSVAMANEEDAAPKARTTYDDLFPACAGGCGDSVERGGERCYSCASDREYSQHVASKRARRK